MRYSDTQKDEARARMIAAAGRAFRRNGYGGIGVDGLAKEAGVTSGAFYGHFSSKDDAFAQAAIDGLDQLDQAVAALQAAHPRDWAKRFIDFYLGERLTCDLSDSCALQSLTCDVMRAGSVTRERYEVELGKVIDRIAGGLDWLAPVARAGRATALLALLSGGVTMARSTASQAVQQAMADQMKEAARLLLGKPM